MHLKPRGWIMSEADMLSMLRMIDEKIRLPETDVRHHDVLIRLRAIVENDLDTHRFEVSSEEPPHGQKAAV